MAFQLTEEQLVVQELVRQFAEKIVAPRAKEVDEKGRFPADTVKRMAEQGLLTINVPEEYGGAGLDEMCKLLAIIELAKKCASTAEIFAVQGLVNEIILRHGTEEQKQKYLRLAGEGKLGAFALTEPGAGSDAGGLKTKAVKDGEQYVLNGTKCFISNMGKDEGDFAIIVALTDPSAGTRGMTTFIVDRDTPGFSVGKVEEKMGMRGAAVSELVLDNVRIPESQRLGKEGEGFKIAMAGLDGGRVGIAAQSIGLAKGCLEEAVNYAKQRVQFGKPIAALQTIQNYVAEMAARIEAAYSLMVLTSNKRMAGEPSSKECAMTKYIASETCKFAADTALQIHGGYGYMKDYAIERMYRDARILTIYEGTSEVQRVVIARALLR
ncbi:MAG: acyl-CoA dehydrogenase family protein [Erysipelotrichaceae bacterium]|nr:acyl-CoA dehydrogenase family protein [Erysipelotrichaceae bacterium]